MKFELTQYKGIFFRLVIDFSISLLLTFISLRTFLMNSGYQGYADIYWPLTTKLYGSLSFVPSISIRGEVFSFFNFTRDFLLWPNFFFTQFSNNIQFVERATIFCGVFLFYILCYSSARFIFKRIVTSFDVHLSKLRSEVVIQFLAIFSISNLVAINYLVDGGFFTVDLIIVFMAITLTVATMPSSKQDWILVGVLISVSALLDPDYYIIFISTTLFIYLAVGLKVRQRLKVNIKSAFSAILVSIPVIIFILLSLNIIASPGSTAFFRSLDSIGFNASNRMPYYGIALFGHAWSIITFAPPSIISYGSNISQVGGILHPTQVLLPSGIITYLWLLSLYTIPFVAFLSCFIKKYKNVTFPVAVISFLALFMFSTQVNWPTMYFFEALIRIPAIGKSIETSISLPGHFLVVLVATYIVLIPLTLISLLSADEFNNFYAKYLIGAEFIEHSLINENFRTNVESNDDQLPSISSLLTSLSPKIKKYWRNKTFLALILVCLMLVSSWQSFDGSFYPARSGNSFFQGNGVPNAGAFSPYFIPNEYLKAYDYVLNNSEGMNVYWPIAIGNYPPSSHPISLPGIKDLVKNGLSSDIVPYLLANSVRFIVVYNITNFTQPLFHKYKEITSYYLNYFGTNSYRKCVVFFNDAPNLTSVFETPVITVFAVKSNNYSLFYRSNLLLSVNGGQDAPALYSAFKSLDINISETSDSSIGVPLGLNNESGSMSLITPSYILANSTTDLSYHTLHSLAINGYGTYYVNSTMFKGNTSLLDSSGGNRNVGNYTVTNWGGKFNVSNNKGRFVLVSSKKAQVSIGYGLPPISNTISGVSLSKNQSEIETTFLAFNGSNGNTKFKLYQIGLNSALSPVKYSITPLTIPNSTQRLYSLKTIMPESVRYIGSFLSVSGLNGTVIISFINTSITSLPQMLDTAPDVPFGKFYSNNNLNVTIPVMSKAHVLLAILRGVGKLDNQSLNSTHFTQYIINITGSDSLLISGDLDIAYILYVVAPSIESFEGNYVSYNVPSSKLFLFVNINSLEIPHTTVNGLNLYLNITSKRLTIVTPMARYIDLAYVSVLFYIGFFIFMFNRKRGKQG